MLRCSRRHRRARRERVFYPGIQGRKGRTASVELLLQGADLDSSAEMVDELMNEEERSTFQARFQALPPSDCGPGINPIAVAIEENESERGQLLLMGGRDGKWDTIIGGVQGSRQGSIRHHSDKVLRRIVRYLYTYRTVRLQKTVPSVPLILLVIRYYSLIIRYNAVLYSV